MSIRFGETVTLNIFDKLSSRATKALQTSIIQAVQANRMDEATDLYTREVLGLSGFESLKTHPNRHSIAHFIGRWFELGAQYWKEAFGQNKPQPSFLSLLTNGRWGFTPSPADQTAWEKRIELQKKFHHHLYKQLLPLWIGEETVATLRQIRDLPIKEAAKSYKQNCLDIDLDEFRNDPTIPPQYVETRAMSSWLSTSCALADFIHDFERWEKTCRENPEDPYPSRNELLYELGPTEVEQRNPDVKEAWRNRLEHTRLMAEQVLLDAGSPHYSQIRHRLPATEFHPRPPDFKEP